MGPLAGIKVLDLSRVLAGPWAGQCLADFGAEVVKIERPGSGDDTRAWGPPWFGANTATSDAAAPGSATPGESAYFLSANRGKKSVAIDITQPEGAALVQRLACQADIVLENFKVGGLAKYGLDFASLAALNPRLVVCSITGFGQTGPLAHLPGYDAMIQAQGGIMSLTGVPDGEPGAGPQKVGVAVADLMTGMYAVSAVLAALHHREKTGVGQHIDLSLLDTQVTWLANQALNYLVSTANGQPSVPQRLGSAHPNIVPYQSFQTSDGYLTLAVGNDRQFASFCSVAGAPETASDPRFSSNAARVANRATLVPICAAWLASRSTATWLMQLAAANVPCGPINDIAQVFAHPQVQARGVQFDLAHASGQRVPQVANPVRFSTTPIAYHRAPPLLGQHTHEVLSTALGLSAHAIAALSAAGVVALCD
jgi:crotonobetainyl-CoA:carnitine CoA-transferase CaiB-like acyl-CoA transferase